MFTGLIQTTGTVVSLVQRAAGQRLTIEAPRLARQWKTGDSIAVNGVCLTALHPEGEITAGSDCFAADLGEETLRRTTLAGLATGALVNLELPTRAGAPLGGHVVQGHVDGTGTLVDLRPIHADREQTDWRLAVDIPVELLPSIAPQGSITVNGISLTVASVSGSRVEISVIPHTYRATHLHTLRPGAAVNIETDVLARYAERRASLGAEAADLALNAVWGVAATEQVEQNWLTAEYLLANGY